MIVDDLTSTIDGGSSVVYEKTVSLISTEGIIDWYTYFFDPVVYKDFMLLTGIPVFGEATVTITITKPSGDVSCGMCIVGMESDLGITLSSPTLGINDYSKKVTDDFGNTSLVKRSFAKKMGVKTILENSQVDRVHSVLSSVRAEPAIWVGSDKYSSMLVYGFFRDFEIDIAYPNESYATINIEGMI